MTTARSVGFGGMGLLGVEALVFGSLAACGPSERVLVAMEARVARAESSAPAAPTAIELAFPPEPPPAELRQAPEAVLQGVVLDAAGAPFAPVRLQLARLDEKGRRHNVGPALVSPDGGFEYTYAPEGELELRAWYSESPGVWRWMHDENLWLERGAKRELVVRLGR